MFPFTRFGGWLLGWTSRSASERSQRFKALSERTSSEEVDNAWAEYEELFAGMVPVEEPPPRPLWRRLAGWLAVAAVIAVLGLGFREAGLRLHNPSSRIPMVPTAEPASGLLGTTAAMVRDLRTLDESMALNKGSELLLVSDVQRLEFPRTVGDRLFGKREEDALIFSLKGATGSEFRVMVLRDGGDPQAYAIEPRSFGLDDDLSGIFYLVWDSEVQAMLEAAMPAVEAAPRHQHSSENFTIFGPFNRGDTSALQQRIDGNIVMSHLASSIDAGGDRVSVAAPALLVQSTPSDRNIKAIYFGRENLVMQPLWGANETDSLAHELVHAYLDEAAPNAAAVRRQAQAYLEANQLHLYRDIVGDLYERLDGLGQAEETLAFLVGAIAERRPTTVAPVQVLANQNLSERSAVVLTSDVEFLIGAGLLPSCMEPKSLGHTKERIDFAYFDAVEDACR
jgi:hypothetical protein